MNLGYNYISSLITLNLVHVRRYEKNKRISQFLPLSHSQISTSEHVCHHTIIPL